MRPLFKIALTMLIGASIVIAYKVYAKKSRKRGAARKISRAKRAESADEIMSPSSEISQNPLHISGSEKVRLDNKLGKLRGRKSDSEIREIEQQNVDFQNHQLIVASKNDKATSSTLASETGSTTTSGLTVSSISNSSMASSSAPSSASASASGSSDFQLPSQDSGVRIAETFNVVDPESNKTEPSTIITTSTSSNLGTSKSE
ncbi:unnamed protein product [Caenorhabditis angaria]|uniref:Uncharacterized protein n=1 Tax=Caenorhabditis angaria TaxID=860376 RepID=A0A9P1N1C9_9PELO|nr:unnamed protein product [Caenorhabditis angaria]